MGWEKNGEGAHGAPIIFQYNFPFFCPFGLKEVLCYTLHILAKLIDEIVYKFQSFFTFRPCSFPLKHILCPSRLFFTLWVKWTCSSHLSTNFQGGRALLLKILRGLQPPNPPGSYAGDLYALISLLSLGQIANLICGQQGVSPTITSGLDQKPSRGGPQCVQQDGSSGVTMTCHLTPR